jgi:uncharacterized coiled-coil protein SlyX
MATITKADLERTVMHQQNVIARKDAQLKTLKAQFDSLKEYLNQTPDFSDEELDELMRVFFEGIKVADHPNEVPALEWSAMLKLTLLRGRNGA